MPLASPSRTGLVDQVIASMQQMISTHEWPIGERIPTEPELVAALGVGRNTVREAVRALSHSGVLEARQGDGTYVRAPSELPAALRRRVAAAELRSVIEVRRAYETEAARLAATRRTSEDIKVLERACVARDAAWRAGDLREFVDADVAFHLAVVDAAKNPLLSELYVAFADLTRDSVAAVIGPELRDDNYVDHGQLLEALRAQDVDAAMQATACFLREILPD
ncbi:FadR/GntR family transcriptional regulator [Kribbella sp. NPDC059898]|uniref:FadR/GntR family transcriptional regulator n=1 Tax=Kribbella sp. NPDC059898 TaxID=3346995 RepID=UPI00365CCB82